MRFVLFSTDGRINRRQYWLMGVLPILVTAVVLSFLGGAVVTLLELLITGQVTGESGAEILVAFGVGLLLFYPTIAVYAKRWHDLNRSGYWTLIFFIPLIGLIGPVVLGLWPGTKGPNSFDLPVAD